MDVATPSVHEPVLFQTARDPLGASYLGWYLLPCIVFPLLLLECLFVCGLIGDRREQKKMVKKKNHKTTKCTSGNKKPQPKLFMKVELLN